jgi:hypothetical protein
MGTTVGTIIADVAAIPRKAGGQSQYPLIVEALVNAETDPAGGEIKPVAAVRRAARAEIRQASKPEINRVPRPGGCGTAALASLPKAAMLSDPVVSNEIALPANGKATGFTP